MRNCNLKGYIIHPVKAPKEDMVYFRGKGLSPALLQSSKSESRRQSSFGACRVPRVSSHLCSWSSDNMPSEKLDRGHCWGVVCGIRPQLVGELGRTGQSVIYDVCVTVILSLQTYRQASTPGVSRPGGPSPRGA